MDHATLWNNYMKCYDFLNRLDSYSANIMDVALHTEVKPGLKVLDAGSGTGNLSILLSAQGANVISCDFSMSALAVHAKKDPQATLVQTSLEEQLPFGNDSFDRICCASVLFTLSRSGCLKAISEFHRIIRPGGKVIVTAGTRTASLLRLVQMYLASVWRCPPMVILRRLVYEFPTLMSVLYFNLALRRIPDWQGFHLFTEFELRSLLAGAGFSCISIKSTYGGCFLLAEGWKSSEALSTTTGVTRTAA